MSDNKPIRGKFQFNPENLKRTAESIPRKQSEAARLAEMAVRGVQISPEDAASELLRRKRGSRRGWWLREQNKLRAEVVIRVRKQFQELIERAKRMRGDSHGS